MTQRTQGSLALKRCVLALLVPLACFAVAELAFRVVFAVRIGPSVLWFGTPAGTNKITALTTGGAEKAASLDVHTVRTHAQRRAGYTKYFPNQSRTDHDPETGDVFDVTINRQGFRGADFPVPKSEGTTLVATLGASSTFGYYNRDSTTYPVLLENELNQRCQGAHYQVVNLGIPHLRSEQILELFLQEGVVLEPDVVTFYEGVNDAAYRPKNLLWSRLRRTLVLCAFIDNVGRAIRRYSAEDIQEHIDGKGEVFVANLTRMRDASRERGALFILAPQQAKSNLVPKEEIRGVTYAQDLALVREKLAREPVNNDELAFLAHDVVTAAARRWAEANGVPIADVIDSSDDRRDVLQSWVHLNPTGNRIVAETLARTIVEETCDEARTRAGTSSSQPTPSDQ